MKKLIYTAGFALGLSLAGISSSAFASEGVDSSTNNVLVEQNALFEKANENLLEPKNSVKRSLGTDHPTPYSQITTYSDGSASGVDFSEATFYDEAGNVIEPPMDSDTDLITPLSDGTSGGTWSSGSGYNCAKGVKVSGWYSYPSIEMNFKAVVIDDVVMNLRSEFIECFYLIKVYFIFKMPKKDSWGALSQHFPWRDINCSKLCPLK
ncbi:hypothetical protein [Lysinibacillus halotolerans]|uniref:Uncharacterized protein n=1 Tax=Lysinibacillus halotolerans TaxID=1368476 RepID=A0A3M8GYR7_9BACI|nr:hypothetical protein [Lysinibacillus halotolerans]RNC95401.1 hypothetical protein EC501_18045 [Lysinibacillus halotolerans]